MTDRDYRILQFCQPPLVLAMNRLLADMVQLGHPMMVTDGFRSVEQQQALYAKGRTTPGPDVSATRPLGRTVTKADGVIHRSNHQSGNAADCCFVVDRKPSWDEQLPWELYGETAERYGLSWGGRWTPPDKPHVEWTANQTDT